MGFWINYFEDGEVRAVLDRYETWDSYRDSLNKIEEEGGTVPASAWEWSDDDAVELLRKMAGLLARVAD